MIHIVILRQIAIIGLIGFIFQACETQYVTVRYELSSDENITLMHASEVEAIYNNYVSVHGGDILYEMARYNPSHYHYSYENYLFSEVNTTKDYFISFEIASDKTLHLNEEWDGGRKYRHPSIQLCSGSRFAHEYMIEVDGTLKRYRFFVSVPINQPENYYPHFVNNTVQDDFCLEIDDYRFDGDAMLGDGTEYTYTSNILRIPKEKIQAALDQLP